MLTDPGLGITYLVDHAVPGVACVVDDDVDFAVAEVCGLLDERVDVLVVEHVSGDSEGLATALVDGVRDVLCFVYGGFVSYTMYLQMLGDQELHDRRVLEMMFSCTGRNTNRHRYR